MEGHMGTTEAKYDVVREITPDDVDAKPYRMRCLGCKYTTDSDAEDIIQAIGEAHVRQSQHVVVIEKVSGG